MKEKKVKKILREGKMLVKDLENFSKHSYIYEYEYLTKDKIKVITLLGDILQIELIKE